MDLSRTSPRGRRQDPNQRRNTNAQRCLTPMHKRATLVSGQVSKPQPSVGASPIYGGDVNGDITNRNKQMAQNHSPTPPTRPSKRRHNMPTMRSMAQLGTLTPTQQSRNRPHHSALKRWTRRTRKHSIHLPTLQPITGCRKQQTKKQDRAGTQNTIHHHTRMVNIIAGRGINFGN